MSYMQTLYKQTNVMYLKQSWERTELDVAVAHTVPSKVTMHLTINVIAC